MISDVVFMILKYPLKVEEIMTKNVVTIDRAKTVIDAAKLMTDNDVGCLIVMDANSPVGVVTERDIVRRVVLKILDAGKTQVDDVMSTPLISVESGMTIFEAADKMKDNKIRRLAVIEKGGLLHRAEKGKLIGILTSFDLVKNCNFIMDQQTQAILSAFRRGLA